MWKQMKRQKDSVTPNNLKEIVVYAIMSISQVKTNTEWIFF